MTTINRRLRYLEVYAVISLTVFSVLAFSAFTRSREQFTEIDVERLNVREPNGQLVMVVANSKRMPDPIINGKSWKTERPAGMLFFNGLGDENGGFVFGQSREEENMVRIRGSLLINTSKHKLWP